MIGEGGSYDGAYQKWVPVPRSSVLPDGSAYVVERPLVELYPPAAAGVTPLPELWLVSGPGQATRLKGTPLSDRYLQPRVTDSRGTWLVGSDGFYLYTDSGFTRAAPMPPGPVGDFYIAGGCV